MSKKKTTAKKVSETYADMVFSRADLLQGGGTGGDITRAVRSGALLRLRRNRYAYPEVDADVAEAVRIGGRIACLTVLQKIGVFVLEAKGMHIHLTPQMSRLRPRKSKATVFHWSKRTMSKGPKHAVSVRDAVLQAMLCQEPRAAIATLDSVLHLQLASREQLEKLFTHLPARLLTLLKLADGTSESGSETFVRLILRSIGVHYEAQVEIPGVGRVDFVVDGWLIIECDSKEFHEGWAQQVIDRNRDIAAARLGYTTIRPIAADIFADSAAIRSIISDVLDAFAARDAAQRDA